MFVVKVEEPWSVASNMSVSDDGKATWTPGIATADDNWLYMSAVCYLYGLGVGGNVKRRYR